MKIQAGDYFGERSHYTVVDVKGKDVDVYRHETKDFITIENGVEYLEKLCQSAVHWDKEVKVGEKDKHWTAKQLEENPDVTAQVGDLKVKGMRTIFAELPVGEPFAVVYWTKNKPLTKKAYSSLKMEKFDNFIQELEKTQRFKEGVVDKAKELLMDIIDNPILDFVPGYERKLVGHKTQQYSHDNFYEVYDAHVSEGHPYRQVNVDTITELITGNVRYVKE